MRNFSDIVFVSAVRTPMGSFGGTLREMPVYEMASFAAKEAIKRANLNGDEIDESIIGNCRQAGNRVNPGRTVALKAGCAQNMPGFTINKACPAGLKAISMAVTQIAVEQGDIILCGGMESMSTIPFLLRNVRWDGFRMGDKVLEDGWSDSQDPVALVSMGMTAENVADKWGITKVEMDEYAVRSHRLAYEAQQKGYFDEEITPVVIPATNKKPEKIFAKDESIKPETTMEILSKLRPAFKKDGMVTAGNACGLTDGAAMLIAMTREKAKEKGLKPLFSVIDFVSSAVDGKYMGEGPGVAIPKLLKRTKMEISDIDLFEINEAFASQVLANVKMLNLDINKLNLNGGAIALGHPTGCSGARIVVTLYHLLKRMDKEIGCASICGGGGATMAMLIKRES